MPRASVLLFVLCFLFLFVCPLFFVFSLKRLAFLVVFFGFSLKILVSPLVFFGFFSLNIFVFSLGFFCSSLKRLCFHCFFVFHWIYDKSMSTQLELTCSSPCQFPLFSVKDLATANLWSGGCQAWVWQQQKD